MIQNQVQVFLYQCVTAQKQRKKERSGVSERYEDAFSGNQEYLHECQQILLIYPEVVS